MATKIARIKSESLTNPIAAWDFNGHLILAEEDEQGNALIADVLVFNATEEETLLFLLVERRKRIEKKDRITF